MDNAAKYLKLALWATSIHGATAYAVTLYIAYTKDRTFDQVSLFLWVMFVLFGIASTTLFLIENENDSPNRDFDIRRLQREIDDLYRGLGEIVEKTKDNDNEIKS